MNYNVIAFRYSRWSLYDNLIPPQFIEVPVPSKENERHVCVLRVSNCPLISTILIFEFGIVPTVWYLFHILFIMNRNI
jgi:hypothetical protein